MTIPYPASKHLSQSLLSDQLYSAIRGDAVLFIATHSTRGTVTTHADLINGAADLSEFLLYGTRVATPEWASTMPDGMETVVITDEGSGAEFPETSEHANIEEPQPEATDDTADVQPLDGVTEEDPAKQEAINWALAEIEQQVRDQAEHHGRDTMITVGQAETQILHLLHASPDETPVALA